VFLAKIASSIAKLGIAKLAACQLVLFLSFGFIFLSNYGEQTFALVR
jgi:hypothetical protein